ncbi:hypothetical protein [Rhodoferax sp.]|uniref:hypothetical protein n=1 Tax=Rhodoferax sp. TaxID=50421 RepID=UPI002717671B|nr:hypothetical protein [Rhodoferax sp.]MDO9200281.1 hypothetical protein [Hydrogenophaga sp.]MDP3191784.1 hypothetical protein [Rhodoferax sp.]MDP3863074.1 hypothetical protein [Rhodoferax sp.]
MKTIFGVLSLLIVVAVVGTMVKKQLTGVTPISITQQEAGQAAAASAPQGNAQQQSQQIQQQVRQSLDAAMQQARPVPEDK